MKSVKQNSEYYTRLLTKLNDQKRRSKKSKPPSPSCRKRSTSGAQTLASYLNNLTVQ
ncbi:MAG: hypothetical protein R3E58_08790 [Phycisphaerae bacterium]